MVRMLLAIFLSLGGLGQAVPPIVAADDNARPVVIAHRGASGYLPEHTLAAYRLGIEQGADYIEPDLVMTKDGYLVARHDIYLSTTTDVAAHDEFANKKRTVGDRTDWFVFDFTLEELKTLKAVQPWPDRDQSQNGQYDIPTFSEILALIATHNKAHDAHIGLYPEMKQPGVFLEMGLDPTATLLAAFKMMEEAKVPFYFQCFDPNYLMALRPQTDAKLVMLLYEVDDEVSGERKANIPMELYADSVDGIGISKALLASKSGVPTDIVERAHDRGLIVHAWTIRDDRVAPGFNSSTEEMKAIFSMGVDGVFSDFPDTARSLVDSSDLAKPKFK